MAHGEAGWPHEILLCEGCVGTTYSVAWDHIEPGEHDCDPTTDVCDLCGAHGATNEAVASRY